MISWYQIVVFTLSPVTILRHMKPPPPFRSRAQARQDMCVASMFDNMTNGYYVDLASNDATRISNTYLLDRALSWRGVCIEPQHRYIEGYVHHRNVIVIGTGPGACACVHVLERTKLHIAVVEAGTLLVQSHRAKGAVETGLTVSSTTHVAATHLLESRLNKLTCIHESQTNMAMYRSPCTMNPMRWGRYVWDALFALASDFPHVHACDDDVVVSDAEIVRRRDAMWGLLCSVEVLLPCKSCQEHFATHLRMLRENAERREEVLHDRESVMLWLYSVKDEVDRMQRFCLRTESSVVRHSGIWISSTPRCSPELQDHCFCTQ